MFDPVDNHKRKPICPKCSSERIEFTIFPQYLRCHDCRATFDKSPIYDLEGVKPCPGVSSSKSNKKRKNHIKENLINRTQV